MAIWEEFEIQCTDYLNNRFGAYARFFHQGGADSTVPDILVAIHFTLMLNTHLLNADSLFYYQTLIQEHLNIAVSMLIASTDTQK